MVRKNGEDKCRKKPKKNPRVHPNKYEQHSHFDDMVIERENHNPPDVSKRPDAKVNMQDWKYHILPRSSELECYVLHDNLTTLRLNRYDLI